MKNNEITKRPDMGIFDKQFPVRLIDAPIDDPTKFTILTGDDGILDDLFSYQVYNHLKNHWRAAVAPADIQPGMIWSDSDDDKLYHHGAADEEILQLTRSSDVSPYFANLYLAEYIYHTGDLDTWLRLRADRISIQVGGTSFIDMVETTPDYLQLLTGKNFIGDNLNADMTIGLTINQAANADEILAFKASNVDHGITDEVETDTFGHLKKWVAASGGILMEGYTESASSVKLQGVHSTENTTKTTAGRASIELVAYKKVAAAKGNVGADANIVAIRCGKGGGEESIWIVDEDGDSHQQGTVYIPNHPVTVAAINAGIVAATGGIYRSTAGNRKYKDNIQNLELDTSLMYDLRPISFTSKCKDDDKTKRHHGLLADEVEPIYPDMIEYDEEGEPDTIDYRAVQVVMLKEIQNLNDRITELEKLN